MSPTTVATIAGSNRRARMPGDSASDHDTANATPSLGAFTSPLVDPPGSATVPPRRFKPVRVNAGPAAPLRPPEAPSSFDSEAPASAIEPEPEPEPSNPDPIIVAPEAIEPAPAPQAPAPEAGPRALAPSPSLSPSNGQSAPAADHTLSAPQSPAPEKSAPAPASTSAEGKASGGDPKAPTARKGPTPAPRKTKGKAASPKAPRAQSSNGAMEARNAMLGLALAYVDRASAQIGAPISFLLSNLGLLLIGLAHLATPLALTAAIATLSPAMRFTFLEGGALSNIGKLLWLYVICAFLWSLTYMGAARLGRALRGDLTRFERIGRGVFSPNSKEH